MTDDKRHIIFWQLQSHYTKKLKGDTKRHREFPSSDVGLPSSVFGQCLRQGWQIGKEAVNKGGAGYHNRPDGEKEDLEIGEQGAMGEVPHFQFAFIGGDDRFIEFPDRHGGFRDPFFLIAKDDGPDTGDARYYCIDPGLDLGCIGLEVDFHLRSWPDEAHIAGQDIEELGKLVDLGDAQPLADGGDAGVVAQGEGACTHVGAVLEHGGELPDAKETVLITYPLLLVENLALTGEAKGQHDWEEEG